MQSSPPQLNVMVAPKKTLGFSMASDVWLPLKYGGLYILDELLPQSHWPADHPLKVETLIESFEKYPDFFIAQFACSTRHIIATRRIHA